MHTQHDMLNLRRFFACNPFSHTQHKLHFLVTFCSFPDNNTVFIHSKYITEVKIRNCKGLYQFQ